MSRVSTLNYLCVRQLKITNEFESELEMQVGLSLKMHREWQRMVEEIIKHIHSYTGYIYGGYVRDMYAKCIFHDIDTKIPYHHQAKTIITWLEQKYNVKMLKENYKQCVSIEVINRQYPSLIIYLDLTFDNGIPQNINGDFDVNTLKWKGGNNYDLTNPKCNFIDVVKNCFNKKFIVLDKNGNPAIKHDDPDQQCIRRNSGEGQKLMMRIHKMVHRGWECINEPCKNIYCALAPDQNKLQQLGAVHLVSQAQPNVIHSRFILDDFVKFGNHH